MINNIYEKVERYFMRKTKDIIWKPSMLLIFFYFKGAELLNEINHHRQCNR